MPTQTLLTHLIKTTAIRYRKQEQVQRETACKTCIFIPVVVYHIYINFFPNAPSFCCLEPSSSRLTFQSFPSLPAALPSANLPSNPLLSPCTITKGSAT